MRANACTACKACLHIQVGPCIRQQAQQVGTVSLKRCKSLRLTFRTTNLHIQVGPCIGQQAQQVGPVRPVCRQHGGGPPAKVDKERQAVWNQELRAGATSRE